ncbi:MAG: dTDP-4-dehydrorhamnose 3,5-epimerase [Deltaproteobacteria bacterium]
MKITTSRLEGVVFIDPKVHGDARGFFTETYHAERYREAGIDACFVQDNHSKSVRDTLRGLHAQLTHPQAKLLRVVQGRILDVVVDIRRGSPTFSEWVAVELSAENFRQIFVPIGFAHGFCVLSDTAEVEYKCSDIYDPSGELTLRWNDPAIGIEWPTTEPLLSNKDRNGRTLAACCDDLPLWSGKEK